jgi:hypothetical protein
MMDSVVSNTRGYFGSIFQEIEMEIKIEIPQKDKNNEKNSN